jgi:tight adherence protein C
VPIVIAIASFVFLLVVITGFGYLFFVRPKNLLRQLEAITSSTPTDTDEPAEPETTGRWKVTSSLQWLGEKMPLSPEESSFTRKELAAAGYRSDNAVTVFVGIRIACATVLTLLALIFRHRLVSNNTLGLVLVGFVALGSYFLVGFVLSHLVDARRERLRMSLPDALDLLVVCVEAGQGLDQAMRVVSRELEFSHRELSEELSLVSLEMRAGKARSEALSHMAERTGESELKKLVSVLIQTDRFGTSVGEALRTHGDYLRVRRAQDAEERAGKVGVKLIFPIFFCIMPSIMIVSAGPGMLVLFRQLGSLVNEMK